MKSVLWSLLPITMLIAFGVIISMRCCNNEQAVMLPKKITSPKTQQMQMLQAEKKYTQQIKKLQEKNNAAEIKLQTVLKELKTARNAQIRYTQKMATAIAMINADSLSQSRQVLTEQLNLVEYGIQVKDSLCDEAIAIQNNQLKNKDSTILLLEDQYTQTKEKLTTTLKQHQLTTSFLKREKKKKAVLKIAIVAMGSFLLFKK